MALDPKLLEILACPEDKGPLLYFADEAALYNPRLKRRYARAATTSRSCSSTRPRRSTTPSTQRLMAKADAEGIQPTFEA